MLERVFFCFPPIQLLADRFQLMPMAVNSAILHFKEIRKKIEMLINALIESKVYKKKKKTRHSTEDSCVCCWSCICCCCCFSQRDQRRYTHRWRHYLKAPRYCASHPLCDENEMCKIYLCGAAVPWRPLRVTSATCHLLALTGRLQFTRGAALHFKGTPSATSC